MPDFGETISAGFTSRSSQLEWMDRIFRSREGRQPTFVITGPAGSGKSTFLKQYLVESGLDNQSRWFNLQGAKSIDSVLMVVHEELMGERERRQAREPRRRFRDEELILVFDSAEMVSDEELLVLSKRVQNYKLVRGTFFLSRNHPELERAHVLTLASLSELEIRDILKRGLTFDLTDDQLLQAASWINGLPLAADVLIPLMNAAGPTALQPLLTGHLYELGGPTKLILPESVKPQIISATDELVAKLKMHPDTIYKLPPRKFEELLADILTDMGAEVELTPETRDGGCDILARVKTEVGKILCLVEAKRYGKTKKVGIELIRNLLFVMNHKKANSAMMVTTATFTKGVKQFQKEYEWQLQLREYGDIAGWIQGYKTGTRSPFTK